MKNWTIGLALFSGIVTVIVSLFGYFGSTLWYLLDAALILWCAYGVYKNSVYLSLTLAIYQTYNFFSYTIIHQNNSAFMGMGMMIVFWINFVEMKKNYKKVVI